MTVVYRLCKRQHQDAALDGEGARRYGGRWNSTGRRVIYASESRALALLEILVHLEDEEALREGYVLFEITLPDQNILTLPRDLPDGWKDYPANPASKSIGDQWLASRASLALAVPSVLLPQESNILINPDHPDFADISVEGPFLFEVDSRLK